MVYLVAFELYLKEKGKDLESVICDYCEGKEAAALFSKVKENFSDYLVSESPEEEPFLYMKLSPIKTEHRQMASFIPTACFKVEIADELVIFIKENHIEGC